MADLGSAVTIALAGRTGDQTAFLLGLGDRIRMARLALRMSQDQLARSAGVTRSFLSMVELGRHGPNVLHLVAVARALGVTAGSLIDDPDPQHPRAPVGPRPGSAPAGRSSPLVPGSPG